jgi:predicted nuclease of predicted toxin-antitoxin system
MMFLVDAQLPPALVIWLQEHGHSAQHVDEVGLREAEDVDIWNYALSTGASVITKDEDFAERTTRTSGGPPIIWLRIGNSTNRTLIHWLLPRWQDILLLLKAGNRLIEVH